MYIILTMFVKVWVNSVYSKCMIWGVAKCGLNSGVIGVVTCWKQGGGGAQEVSIINYKLIVVNNY